MREVAAYNVAFFCAPFFGHFNPTLGLVRALTDLGIQVDYYSWDKFADQIKEAGGTYHRIPVEGVLEIDRGKPLTLEVSNVVLKDSLTVAEVLLPKVQNKSYDFLIYDYFTFWGRLIHSILNIPRVITYPLFVQHRLTVLLSSHEFRRHLKRAKYTAQLLAQFEQQSEEISKKFPIGTIKPKDLYRDIEADLSIVYTTRKLQPFAGKFNSSYHFVGPSFGDRNIPEPSIPIDSDRRLIYISLGTVFVDNLNLINTLIKSFSETPYQIIISFGMADAPQFANLPAHIEVHKSVNPFQVLRHASVFINHAGFNSVMESIWFNVPMICFPRTGDQMLNARIVARKRLGLIGMDHFSPSKILKMSRRLISNNAEYRARSARFSRAFKPYESGKIAARIIYDFMTEKLS